jgi:hypothetical protein
MRDAGPLFIRDDGMARMHGDATLTPLSALRQNAKETHPNKLTSPQHSQPETAGDKTSFADTHRSKVREANQLHQTIKTRHPAK